MALGFVLILLATGLMRPVLGPETTSRAVRTGPAESAPPRPPAAPDPVGSWERGVIAGRNVRPRSLDDALARMLEGGLGDPRILTSGPNRKVVRLRGCTGCASAIRGPACHFERGYLAGAVATLAHGATSVRETRCRADGDDACDFEVSYT